MSLIPKNWSTFQHYKNRKPPWIKLHRALLDDYAFACLPLASQALAPRLWLLASEYEDGKISAGMDEIAFRLHLSIEALTDALKPLVTVGFFVDDSNTLAPCKQDALLEREIEEEAQERDRGRTFVANATRSADRFEEFWEAYPKRDGANPKAPAQKVYAAAVKAGIEQQEIIDGAKACAKKDRDKIGTPYIPQAVKWLRDKRWGDYKSSVNVVAAPMAFDWETIMATYRDKRIWPFQWPEPGYSGCRVPADVLDRFGYGASSQERQPMRFSGPDDSLPGLSEITHQKAS